MAKESSGTEQRYVIHIPAFKSGFLWWERFHCSCLATFKSKGELLAHINHVMQEKFEKADNSSTSLPEPNETETYKKA